MDEFSKANKIEEFAQNASIWYKEVHEHLKISTVPITSFDFKNVKRHAHLRKLR